MQFGEDVVLADVELTVMHGERVGFVGANGAGKSVLLKTVVGELGADRGRGLGRPVDPDRLPRAVTRRRSIRSPARSTTVRLCAPLLRGRGRGRC